LTKAHRTSRNPLGILGSALAAAFLASAGTAAAPRQPRDVPILIEGESLARSATATDGSATPQNMSAFGGGWSSQAQLFWRAPNPVESARNYPRLTLNIAVSAAGEYAVTIRHTQAPDYGDVRVFVRGAPLGEFEGFAPRVRPARTPIGRVRLVQGTNAIVLMVFRRAPGATAAFVGLDAIELTPLRPAGPPPPPASETSMGRAVVTPVLPGGAKLLRQAQLQPDAPPAWIDTGDVQLNFHGKSTATVRLKWDVTAVPNAKAVAFQVTTQTFGSYQPGEPMQSKAYIASGYRAGATGTLDIDLPLTPPHALPPANKDGMMADYQVRVLPLVAVASPQVVGAASNVFVVKTYRTSAAYSGPAIKTYKIDPTVQVVKFEWVPYKYTKHWPPGCKTGGESENPIEAIAGVVEDVWNWAAGAYKDAKGFVVTAVVDIVATIPPNIQLPPSIVATALDGALMAAGVPPNIPNLDKVMSDGAGFLAQQMVDQMQLPPEVTGPITEQALEAVKAKMREKAKAAILDGAKKIKEASESSSEYCRGLYQYEYIRLTVRNVGNSVQEKIDIVVGDTAQAFKNLSFRIPHLEPGEEVVVPRYLYSPEHLNRPYVTKWQLESENLTESWTLWNQKYFKQSFSFVIATVGQDCRGACSQFQKFEMKTPARAWGKEHAQGFSWPQ
jgi:hypothetical protein